MSPCSPQRTFRCPREGERCVSRPREARSQSGEPRVLAPEADGSDPRPRWIVLTVCDAMRGDVLEGKDADRVVPAMVSLARGGHRYAEAVSAGAHTRPGSGRCSPGATSRGSIR